MASLPILIREQQAPCLRAVGVSSADFAGLSVRMTAKQHGPAGENVFFTSEVSKGATLTLTGNMDTAFPSAFEVIDGMVS